MSLADLWEALSWASLDRELRHWGRAERSARLWWRDDDARGTTPALARLIALSTAHDAPLLLAVTPDGDAAGLAATTQTGRVFLAQHGTDHRDRGVVEACQFAPDDSVETIVAALREGRARLERLTGFLPVYVPPWNRLSGAQIAALPHAGFLGVSAAGPSLEGPDELQRIDIHLDILRWGPPRFRGTASALRRLKRALRRRRLACAWNEPVGVLTHHLDHDEAAWTFLERLLLRLRLHPAINWVSPAVLFDRCDAAARPEPLEARRRMVPA